MGGSVACSESPIGVHPTCTCASERHEGRTSEMSPDQSPEPVAAEGIARRSMPVEYMDDLQDSLARLGQLATGLLSLEESLTRVAQFAVRAIPGAEGAGLTLARGEPVRHHRGHGRLCDSSRRHSVQPRPGPMHQCRRRSDRL